MSSDYDWGAAFADAVADAYRLTGRADPKTREERIAAFNEPRRLPEFDDQDADDIWAERQREKGARIERYSDRRDER